MQNFDNDEDMSGERGCYFKDGKRRIGKLPFNKKPHTSLFMKNICNNSCALTMVDFVFLTFWQEFKIIKSFSSFTHGPVVSHSPREAIFPEKLFSLRSWPPPPFEKKPHPSPSHYTILVSSDFKMVTSYCLFYRLCACLWRRREGAST